MSTLEASNLFDVKNMVFVITGGGSGILPTLHRDYFSGMTNYCPQESEPCSPKPSP